MTNPLVPASPIEQTILTIRGDRVILDADIAALYGVSVGRFNEAVKRNRDRFPADFMFRLTGKEFGALKFRVLAGALKSQIAIAKTGRGGRRTKPYAFTEQGVAMLSSVLRSPRAVRVNIEIMRAFVRLRRILAEHRDLARRLDALERRYDGKFKAVFDAIKQLMAPPPPPPARRRPIGFRAER